jgi:hypothetical protein
MLQLGSNDSDNSIIVSSGIVYVTSATLHIIPTGLCFFAKRAAYRNPGGTCHHSLLGYEGSVTYHTMSAALFPSEGSPLLGGLLVGGRRGTKATSSRLTTVTSPDSSLVKVFRTCNNVHMSERNKLTASMLAGTLKHPVWNIVKGRVWEGPSKGQHRRGAYLGTALGPNWDDHSATGSQQAEKLLWGRFVCSCCTHMDTVESSQSVCEVICTDRRPMLTLVLHARGSCPRWLQS